MQKHVSFWIGFFVAALLTVPIAAGITGAAEAEIRQIAVLLFVGVVGLLLVLIIVLFGRNWILRKVLGSTETALEDVSSALIEAASAASTGDREAAVAAAQDFVGKGLAWYTWSNFYRWVFATALGILVAFGAFVGTVLLFEQTRTLQEQTRTLGEQTIALQAQSVTLAEQSKTLKEQTERFGEQTELMQSQTSQLTLQNEILTISLVGEIRSQLLTTTDEVDAFEILKSRFQLENDGEIVRAEDSSCSASFGNGLFLTRPPSIGTIDAIARVGSSGSLAKKVVEALDFLTRDHNSSVSLGALMVLEKIGTETNYTLKNLRGLYLDEVQLAGAHNIEIRESIISSLNCERCEVNIRSSVLAARTENEYSVSSGIISESVHEYWGWHSRNWTSFFTLNLGGTSRAEDTNPEHPNLLRSSGFDRGELAAIFDHDRQHSCVNLRRVSEANPFMSYRSSASGSAFD